MKPPFINDEILRDFIARALDEDVGGGDHSTLAAIESTASSNAHLLVKDSGVLAGIDLAEMIFRYVDPSLSIERIKADGEPISPGDIAFRVGGNARSILTSERLVLNCLQRMSGIATRTRHMCGLVEGTGAKLMDTRKTTPTLRFIEKWAVIIGGGHNHRMGLYDRIMLKDNHVDMAGGIKNAINRTKSYLRANNLTLEIEVETRSLKEVNEVLETGGIDIVMLDNMPLADIREAVSMIHGKYIVEASGGLTETNLREVALCGVDWISVGALTHSIKSLDMSLKAD